MDVSVSAPASAGPLYRAVVESPTGSVASEPMTLTAAFDVYHAQRERLADQIGPGGVDVYVVDDRDWPQP